MKVVFFGTPDFVVPIVDALHKTYRVPRAKESGVVAVVTQPPSPAGRDKRIDHSPVDQWAWDKKIKVITGFNNSLPDADLGIVAAYGKIIPEKIIKHFPKGILNLHPSLLPVFRGASPIQAAIVTDTNRTGLTVIKMDKLMDHGPIISLFKEDVLPEDTTETLRRKLFERSIQFLLDLIPNYLSKKIIPKEQDHAKATYTKIITREDGFIDPTNLQKVIDNKTPRKKWVISFVSNFTTQYSPVTIHQFIRAMTPWPGTWTLLRLTAGGQAPKRLKIIRAHLSQPTKHNPQLILDEVQLEGKNPVSWEEFKRGYPNTALTRDGV
ncbi:hypothetical protein A3D84_05110 [Candidatus Woesebacteria bacterium RIFCSPHIGHO2_02_FULL_42_20]|uniref:methionyl-tRNA formyltransferase n=1 Tax=Candidatus Woesebacteria bacterium RIFCSPHIGHO2_12_FULL_41_24 TaxID=1802510 RepID=A0A1F8AUV2_9BACT|nr:MAG: hypothetical protein A2W15_00830 [Candidatus Woesebacteria bacterium RBG_16_41_13]OGM30837.1 MAG: hypothetical protein A2873_04415 [Candidatus Woesebacteria bacterium RIFCSPHIGHO2_01_FULL_42_80]OGM34399.1 MAG: hypothetical protein A3D84_05110 [Candidatus Woesebacteria bacterium RIFCSPHIGHO2_02_FULL_42_20]OGM55534.1 MAG: hypothetical protein A3E44_01270 [Candidatus Woesebacteria bacterium RIFCSPHIGHO2_12_FULL_41_24]OGM66202.1 MAG: hypothetical protein A2969_01455 [Candidatus Woesebacteri